MNRNPLRENEFPPSTEASRDIQSKFFVGCKSGETQETEKLSMNFAGTRVLPAKRHHELEADVIAEESLRVIGVPPEVLPAVGEMDLTAILDVTTNTAAASVATCEGGTPRPGPRETPKE